VFRDPKGTHYLDNSTSTVGVNNNVQQSDELETYKKRIESLNVEIIRLNDELEMVMHTVVIKYLFKMHSFFQVIYYTAKFPTISGRFFMRVTV